MRGHNNSARRLIYIPILHTQHDMGSLSAQAKKVYTEKLGKKLWLHHTRSIDEMWAGIKKRLVRLKLFPKQTFVYQDGLPVCGKEPLIVKTLAKQGSPNHKIIEGLLKRGAKVVGTEDPKLLVQEYHFIKHILTAGNNGHKKEWVKRYEQAAPELLKKRDLFIRERIDQTLPPGGTGLLFMGLLHRVDEILPVDIRVSYLIYRLPFHRSFEMEVVA